MARELARPGRRARGGGGAGGRSGAGGGGAGGVPGRRAGRARPGVRGGRWLGSGELGFADGVEVGDAGLVRDGAVEADPAPAAVELEGGEHVVEP